MCQLGAFVAIRGPLAYDFREKIQCALGHRSRVPGLRARGQLRSTRIGVSHAPPQLLCQLGHRRVAGLWEVSALSARSRRKEIRRLRRRAVERCTLRYSRSRQIGGAGPAWIAGRSYSPRRIDAPRYTRTAEAFATGIWFNTARVAGLPARWARVRIASTGRGTAETAGAFVMLPTAAAHAWRRGSFFFHCWENQIGRGQPRGLPVMEAAVSTGRRCCETRTGWP